MKTTSFLTTLAATAALLLVTGAGSSLMADRYNGYPHGGYWDHNHHYYRDNYGYYNNNRVYNPYVIHNHHHGYWDTRGPVRVFINVD